MHKKEDTHLNTHVNYQLTYKVSIQFSTKYYYEHFHLPIFHEDIITMYIKIF
jgi:hypothetical protein